MKRLLLTLFILLTLAVPSWAATYYMRADGTATDKTGATSAAAAATSMSIIVHNNSTFSPGDTIYLSDAGGNYPIYFVSLEIGYPRNYIQFNAFDFMIGSNVYHKAAPASNGVTLSGDSVPTGTYGGWGIDINSSGTVAITQATNNATGYASTALALAGIPAVDGTHCRIGTITIYNNSGSNFVPGTTALNATNVTATYTDNPVLNFLTPPSNGSAGSPITYAKVAGQTPMLNGGIDSKGAAGDWSILAGGGNEHTWRRQDLATHTPIDVWLNGYPAIYSATRTSGYWDYTYSGPKIYITTPGADAPNNPANYFTSIIRSVSPFGMYINGRSYVNVSGISSKYITSSTGLLTLPANAKPLGGIGISGSDHINISYCTTTDSITAVASHDGSDITIDNCSASLIYNNIDTVNLPLGGKGLGFWFDSNSTSVTNCTYNGQFTAFGGSAQNGGQGIRAYQQLHGTNKAGTTPYIAYNHVSYPFGYGINMSANDATCGAQNINGIIEHNILDNGNVTTAGDTDGISVGDTGSFPAGNYCYGMVIQCNKVDGYGNSGGLTANSWRSVSWFNNIITNCGIQNGWGGLAIGNYDIAYNNTIYNVYRSGIRYGGSGAMAKNNIIHTVALQGASYGYGIEGGVGSASSNNCIYNYAAANPCSNWTDTNGITSDPLFVNAGGSYALATDFKLQATSPCINTGTNTGITTDYAGAPRPQ